MQLPEKTAAIRLLFSGQHLLLQKCGDQYQIPAFEAWPAWLGEISHERHIGAFNAYDCHVAEANQQVSNLENYDWIPLRAAIEHLGMTWYHVAARAYQLVNFDKNYRYCGQCSQPTVKTPDTFERRCESCHLLFYPKISPSIIVMICRGNQILLARQARFAPGVYGLIAGFVEPGETLEAALHREVKEEVGLNVNNIRYFGSQPWPFPDTLMLAFIADYAGGEIELVDGELETAGWYDADNLPGLPSSPLSIARQLIDSFLAETIPLGE